jgi:hypothetical protein
MNHQQLPFENFECFVVRRELEQFTRVFDFRSFLFLLSVRRRGEIFAFGFDE